MRSSSQNKIMGNSAKTLRDYERKSYIMYIIISSAEMHFVSTPLQYQTLNLQIKYQPIDDIRN